MNRKMKLIKLVCMIITGLFLVFALLIYPNISYKKDVKIIKNKVTMVYNYFINNTGDIKNIREELKKESVSNSRIEMEKETNKYLNSVLDNVTEYNELRFDIINYMFSDEKIKDNLDDNIKVLKEEKEKLDTIKKAVGELSSVNFDNIESEDNKKLLKEIFDNFKLDDFDKKVDSSLEYDEYYTTLMEFLKKNKSAWDYKNGKIVFNKRSVYNEYQKISKGEEYELVKDTKGPVITASDISVTKGTKINVKDKVSCVDAVDGKVDCKVEGNYDTSKVGSYSIKITATDESKNTSSKTIKLVVKEKTVVKNTKPYYIEVIRNQNVVIVYGLDSNNQYTKIVKVFICSTGKSSSKTPTGTFKTSDKASWGWLVGNLYGKYYTRITGSILFHSVPYTKKAKNTLEWDEYNKLGTSASKGCVRMTVKDVKWIYDNCPRGTTVKIYDGSLPSGVTKPTAQKIDANSPNKGWDPTDPDKNNPWKK